MSAKLYLDLDGVFADFVYATYRIHRRHKFDNVPQCWNYFEDWGITEREFWEPINALGDDFYRSHVLPYSHCLPLLRQAQNTGAELFVATASPDNLALNGKRDWIHDHLGNIETIIISRKELLAGPGCFLLDDRPENVDAFRAAGGKALLFKQPWNNGGSAVTYSERLPDLKEFFSEVRAAANSDVDPPRPALPPTGKATNPKDNAAVSKTPLSVLPQPPLYLAAAGMHEGAVKYGAHNYRYLGIRESVYYNATRRHLDAHWEGEDIDPDSGLPHLAKAISSLLVWLDGRLSGNHNDDRPPRSPFSLSSVNDLISEINEKYPDPVPPYTHAQTHKDS